MRRSWPWWRCALTGLSAIALALSAYLSWHYLMGGSVIGCNGAGSCEEVLGSRWSAVAGVLPVSGLAAGTYLAMLVASLFIGPVTRDADQRLAWGAMLILAGAAAGSAVWFSIVQIVFVRAICPYCLATHITGMILVAIVLWRAPRIHFAVPLTGVALAGILAAGQMVIKPPPDSRGGVVQNTRPAIDPHAVPLVGSPDATYVVTLLFDYRCPHCQELHAMLDEAIRRYDGKLAFALCPAPLNNKCNPFISREVDEFKDSCELAKIGLAVWVANRQAFAAFDNWMFSPDPGQRWRARSLEAARAQAVELVGQEKFDAARADPWIDDFLKTSVGIYGNTINPNQSGIPGGGAAVPKLVFGSHWVTPEPHDASDLVSILWNSLHVPEP
jgi:uncharacterized membrane protein